MGILYNMLIPKNFKKTMSSNDISGGFAFRGNKFAFGITGKESLVIDTNSLGAFDVVEIRKTKIAIENRKKAFFIETTTTKNKGGFYNIGTVVDFVQNECVNTGHIPIRTFVYFYLASKKVLILPNSCGDFCLNKKSMDVCSDLEVLRTIGKPSLFGDVAMRESIVNLIHSFLVNARKNGVYVCKSKITKRSFFALNK